MFRCYCYLIFFFTVGHAFDFDNNDLQLMMDINRTVNLKLWFPHLEIPLAETLVEQLGRNVMVWYALLSSRTHLMVTWCSISRSGVYGRVADDLLHVKAWTPCGYVRVMSGIQPVWHTSNITFHLQTIRKLALQINFLQFDLESLSECVYYSSVHLCLHETADWGCGESLLFCGYRKPWMETTTFSGATVELIQLNVRYPCNLTFTYTSLERQIASVYINHAHYKVMHHTDTDLILKPTFMKKELRVVRKWQLRQELGNRLHFFEMRSCCIAGLLEIYDGFPKYYLLIRKQILNSPEETLNVSSQYYIATVTLQMNETLIFSQDHTLLFLRYHKKPVRIQFLDVDKVYTVKSHRSIVHSIFGINITTGGYPNVSVIVRNFNGWEDDSCSFGGYTFTHQIDSESLKTIYHQGPFCTTTAPSVPFIGTHGPKHVIFGSFQYYLAIYAFGPWYDIDIDIIVSRSACEGVFEPLSICDKVIQDIGGQLNFKSKFVKEVETINYVMRCSATRQTVNDIEYSLFVSHIRNCVNFQSISLIQKYVQRYSFQAFMDVDMDVLMGPSYLPSYLITAEILSVLRISTTFQTLNATTIDHSHNATYRKVGAITLILLNIQQRFGLYLSFVLKPFNHVSNNCSINGSALNYVINPQNNNKLALVDIYNLCGKLVYVKRYIYVIKFSGMLLRDKKANLYLYSYFKSNCIEYRMNTLTILDNENVYHSVALFNRRIYMNRCHGIASYVYQNQKRCSVTIEYRMRQFYVYTQMRFSDIGRPQHFQVNQNL